MHDEDRDFTYWLAGWMFIVVTVVLIVAALVDMTEAQPAPPPRPIAKQVQLRHFPVDGTNYECIVAVTSEDAAPMVANIPQRPITESFNWIGCFDRKSLGITPTPSPEPTRGKVS